MKVAIVDFGAGNLGSLPNALRRIGIAGEVTRDPAIIERADRLILPGVGSFDTAMRNLAAYGLVPALESAVLVDGKPILGICLGMQILTDGSEEGQMPGLGWISGQVRRIHHAGPSPTLKVPHIGWNTVTPCTNSPLFARLDPAARFYFVHSYHVTVSDQAHAAGITEYGIQFVSAVHKKNISGVQFHPEKSQEVGLRLIQNFLGLK
jgi:glutamine amidotransferase